jgi:acyl-CoA thioester hydrolase
VLELFERTFHVGWVDMDFNAHMRNTAYLDRCVDVRLMYFTSRGFAMRELERLRIGPVVRREEVEYFREMRLLEQFRITLAVAALNADASRFALRNEFFKEDGQLAARVTSHGGWLDLAARKLTAPPPALADCLRALARTADYADIA